MAHLEGSREAVGIFPIEIPVTCVVSETQPSTVNKLCCAQLLFALMKYERTPFSRQPLPLFSLGLDSISSGLHADHWGATERKGLTWDGDTLQMTRRRFA